MRAVFVTADRRHNRRNRVGLVGEGLPRLLPRRGETVGELTEIVATPKSSGAERPVTRTSLSWAWMLSLRARPKRIGASSGGGRAPTKPCPRALPRCGYGPLRQTGSGRRLIRLNGSSSNGLRAKKEPTKYWLSPIACVRSAISWQRRQPGSRGAHRRHSVKPKSRRSN